MAQFSISSEREKYLVVLGMTMVVMYVLYFFLITPKQEEINKTNIKLATARLELRTAEIKIKILESVKLPEKALAAPKLVELSPEEKALDTFKQISFATSKSGLKLNTIVPASSQLAGTLKYNLTCDGRYRELYSFLVLLGKLDTVVLVDNLEISGGGSISPVLSIKMDLVAYL